MFSFQRPSPRILGRLQQVAEQDCFSYSELRATLRDVLPAGYNVDHNRIRLGHGEELFSRARTALSEWRMFDIGWVEVIHPPAPAAADQTVLILAHAWNLYSLSASRVLAVIDTDDGEMQRWGFCYGTLQHHVEQGEERFTVEYRHEDDSVWYDILAFSRPQHPLARFAYPLSRSAQRRFARDSKAAMLRAVD